MWGLIYNRGVRTKRCLKEAYATSRMKVWIYKNKLDGRMCAPVQKLTDAYKHFGDGKLVTQMVRW